jgi:hypothetical protein
MDKIFIIFAFLGSTTIGQLSLVLAGSAISLSDPVAALRLAETRI